MCALLICAVIIVIIIDCCKPYWPVILISTAALIAASYLLRKHVIAPFVCRNDIKVRSDALNIMHQYMGKQEPIIQYAEAVLVPIDSSTTDYRTDAHT